VAVRDNAKREIALTLLRSFRKAVLTDGNEGGQIPGTHRFHYSVVPFMGQPDPCLLGRLGQRLAAGIRTIQADPRDPKSDLCRHPDRFSYLEVAGEVLVSSVRPKGDKDLFVRLHNPKDDEVETEIRMSNRLSKARMCDFLDNPLQEVRVQKGKMGMKVPAKTIVNLLLEVK